MKRLFSLPIRVHLILLVVLSVLPAIGILLYSGIEDERALKKGVRADSSRLLDAIGEEQKEAAAATRQLLSVLARLPEIRNHDAKSSGEILRELQRLNPEYVTLSAADGEGNLFASIASFQDVNVADSKYFQEAIATREFSVGEYAVARVVAKPVLHYAYPSIDSSGELRAVVLAGFDLTHFDRALTRAKLPLGSKVTVLDHRGIVLYSSASSDGVGRPDEAGVFDRMRSEDPERFFTMDTAGEAGRLYMYYPVRLATDKSPYLYIQVSFLESEIYGPVRRLIVRNVALLGLAALLAISMAWGWGSYTITNQVKSLVRTVWKVEEGDLRAKTGLSGFGGELGELARAFDGMSETLTHRELERKITEEALREKTDELDRFFKLIPDLLCVSDADGYFRRLNPQWERSLGFAPEELEGHHFCDFVHPDDIVRTQAVVEDLKAQKGAPRFVNRFRCKDGAYRWLEWHVFPFGDMIYAATRDITEQVQAMEALKESEERLRTLINAMPDIVCLKDGKGRWLEANDFELRLFGLVGVDYRGKKDFELAAYSEFYHDTFLTCDEIEEKTWEFGRFSRGDEVIPRPDGSALVFDIIKVPTFYPDGRRKGLVIIGRDITERRRAEDEVRESESRYRIVMEQTGQLIYDWDIPTGTIHWAGDIEQITGYTAEEFQHVNIEGWEERLHPDDRRKTIEILKSHSVGSERHYKNIGYRFQRKDGVYIYIEESGVFLRDETGKAYRMLGTMKDISERKRVEQQIQALNRSLEQRVKDRTAQLEAANKELEAFSYSVSHDLKSPLRALDGFSQIILEDYADRLDDRGMDCLARIRSASQRMGQLIEDMLKLSRITQKEMKFAEVDLSALARKIVDELQAENPERKVDFVVPPTLPVRGDASLLQIALQNLLGNAWKFTALKSEARIELGSMRQDGREVHFVRDNGAGFNMDYAIKLFQAFQRLHRKEEFEGTGIGLAIVKRIVMKHGGEIWARSEIGQGATFYFTL
jgi:PAS domain S-box-containing protein